MVATYSIQLTQLEGLYLSDALSMFTQGPPDELGQGSPYPDLLLKIGSAVLETAQYKAPVTVHLSLVELWMVREVAKSSVVVGNERVGLSLLLKAYEGLRALVAQADMQGLVDDFGEVTGFEPGKADYATQMAQLKDNPGLVRGDGGEEDRYENSVDDKPSDTDKDGANHDAQAEP